MRKAFITTLCELAQHDQRVMLLTGDLGYLLIEPFANQFPDRFINVGVAEQNMIGIATGLAEAGYIPFAYSITPFAVLRSYEFIRNGPVQHQLKVRIVGGGSGFEYSHDGFSHYALEDIGVLRILPGISIFAPADFQQATCIFNKTWDLPGPIYYRLSKDEQSIIPGLSGDFEVAEAQCIGDGKDVLIISMGSITNQVCQAIEVLRLHGIACSLMIIASIHPLPNRSLETFLREYQHVVAVEEHFINGGIGSLVSENVAEGNLKCTVTRCGVRSLPDGKTGSYKNMLERNNLSSEALVRIITEVVKKL